MRVMVTGGAGYIGSTTAAALLAAGHDVVVVDDLRRGHAELVPDGADLVEADIADAARLDSVLRDADAVVHFAAAIEAGESMRSPARYFADNTAATMLFLQQVVDAGISRFVFSSTAAVYGAPSEIPLSEDARTEPESVYGATKLAVERELRWLGRLGVLRSVALRYFNVAGATADRGEDHDPETHLIPLVLAAAAGRRDGIAIYGTDYDTPDGTCVRDYVHVADLADAHLRALAVVDDHDHLVCNLGNGEGFSVREVIDAAGRVTGVDFPVRIEERRPGDPSVLVASSDRARRELGWTPSVTSLDEIVASAWTWHQARWSRGD